MKLKSIWGISEMITLILNSSEEIVYIPEPINHELHHWLPLSTRQVAPAITPAINFPPINIPDPSDKDPPPIPLPPPPLTETVARKSKSLTHQKSFDATLCYWPTTSAPQNNIGEPSTTAKKPDVKTAFLISSETFSLLYVKQSSSSFSTNFIDDFRNWECEESPNKALTSSSRIISLSYSLESTPIQYSSSSRRRSLASSMSALLIQHAQLNSSTSWKPLSFLSEIPV